MDTSIKMQEILEKIEFLFERYSLERQATNNGVLTAIFTCGILLKAKTTRPVPQGNTAGFCFHDQCNETSRSVY